MEHCTFGSKSNIIDRVHFNTPSNTLQIMRRSDNNVQEIISTDDRDSDIMYQDYTIVLEV